jgi:hypothetical protein
MRGISLLRSNGWQVGHHPLPVCEGINDEAVVPIPWSRIDLT